ncbi:hypothetical protein HMPREF9120_02039 [Neisseria sp. oral taxon 020 str. F0370]|nr:hypothetical protein HMPREF9120_02039 [Neisseria sp. oral taxon 020 str. F0370]
MQLFQTTARPSENEVQIPFEAFQTASKPRNIFLPPHAFPI